MIARKVESRITKLEARSARPDEMLVVWRKPDGEGPLQQQRIAMPRRPNDEA